MSPTHFPAVLPLPKISLNWTVSQRHAITQANNQKECELELSSSHVKAKSYRPPLANNDLVQLLTQMINVWESWRLELRAFVKWSKWIFAVCPNAGFSKKNKWDCQSNKEVITDTSMTRISNAQLPTSLSGRLTLMPGLTDWPIGFKPVHSLKF